MDRPRRRSKIMKQEIISNDNDQKNTDTDAKWTDRQLSQVEKIKAQQPAKQQLTKCMLTKKQKLLIGMVVLIVILFAVGLTITLTKVLKPHVKKIQNREDLKFQDNSKMHLIEVVVQQKKLIQKNQEYKIIHSEVQIQAPKSTKNSTQSSNSTENTTTKIYSDSIQFKQLGIIVKITPNSTTKVLIHPKTFVSYMKEKHLQTMMDEWSDQDRSTEDKQWQEQLVSQLTILFNKQYNKNDSESNKVVFNKVPYVNYCLNNQTNRYQFGCLKQEKVRLLEKKQTRPKPTKMQQVQKETVQLLNKVGKVVTETKQFAVDVFRTIGSAIQVKQAFAQTVKQVNRLVKVVTKSEKANQDPNFHLQPISQAQQMFNNCVPETTAKLICNADILDQTKKVQKAQAIQPWFEAVIRTL